MLPIGFNVWIICTFRFIRTFLGSSCGSRISHRGGRRPRRGGRQLPRRLHFEKFVCQNERIWTRRGGARRRRPPWIRHWVGLCELSEVHCTTFRFRKWAPTKLHLNFSGALCLYAAFYINVHNAALYSSPNLYQQATIGIINFDIRTHCHNTMYGIAISASAAKQSKMIIQSKVHKRTSSGTTTRSRHFQPHMVLNLPLTSME